MSEQNNDVRYNLEGLSPQQARLLYEALELRMRLGIGQFEYLMEFVRDGGVTDQKGRPLEFAALEAGDRLTAELKRVLTGFGEGASKSVGAENTPAEAKSCFEMFKAIRHRLAWDRNPEGGHGVYFDDPYAMRHTDEPKVTLTQVDGNKGGQ